MRRRVMTAKFKETQTMDPLACVSECERVFVISGMTQTNQHVTDIHTKRFICLGLSAFLNTLFIPRAKPHTIKCTSHVTRV